MSKISKRTRDAAKQTPFTLKSAQAYVAAMLADPAIGDVTPLDTYRITTASAFNTGELDAFLDWTEATRRAHFAALGREPPPLAPRRIR